ncbi:hypothetical protein ACX93W_23600 [Paenibacillus sp. CAU 1782]
MAIIIIAAAISKKDIIPRRIIRRQGHIRTGGITLITDNRQCTGDTRLIRGSTRRDNIRLITDSIRSMGNTHIIPGTIHSTVNNRLIPDNRRITASIRLITGNTRISRTRGNRLIRVNMRLIIRRVTTIISDTGITRKNGSIAARRNTIGSTRQMV